MKYSLILTNGASTTRLDRTGWISLAQTLALVRDARITTPGVLGNTTLTQAIPPSLISSRHFLVVLPPPVVPALAVHTMICDGGQEMTSSSPSRSHCKKHIRERYAHSTFNRRRSAQHVRELVRPGGSSALPVADRVRFRATNASR